MNAVIDIPQRSPHVPRIYVLMTMMALGLTAILARLWYLQIVLGDDLQEQSAGNIARKVRRTPPRGQIEDRNGLVVATIRPRLVVKVIPDELRKYPETLMLLGELLGVPPIDLAETVKQDKITPFDPVRIAEDIDQSMATRIEERRADLPGVFIDQEPVRLYPQRALFGHLLGQMGEISREDLKSRPGTAYKPGDYCGKLGVERAFDEELRGRDGGMDIEVDARGRMRKVIATKDPVPGETLRLTLDSELQSIAMRELGVWLAQGKPGAAVAMDPNTGAVLALASSPGYDPNLFARGISKADWKRLQEDALKPQINRAVGSPYAPGSTFKVVSAAAGLESGEITEFSSVNCTGSIQLGRWVKHCHKRSGHGAVSLRKAIDESCNVYFYRLGQKLGPERMAEFARKFGLGAPTGIDLPKVESAGTVPDPKWKLSRRLGPWVGGDTVDFAIGQAMLGTTPLQMCRMIAAVANGGALLKPQLLLQSTTFDDNLKPTIVQRLERRETGRLPASSETLSVLRRALQAVVERGTGTRAQIPGIPVAGKTGTAQMAKRGRLVDNAWFVGFAPADKPKIAVAVFVETGGHGGDTAAPIAQKLMARYLGVVPAVANPPTGTTP